MEQIAARAGVSRQAVQGAVKDLPYEKRGRKRVYDPEDVLSQAAEVGDSAVGACGCVR